MAVVKRFDVVLVALDVTQGAEIKKTRPCVVVSPDEMNHSIKTIIVAPMTTKIRDYPTRIHVEFQKKKGEIVLDQIRTLDRSRVIKKLGTLDKNTAQKILEILVKMFS